MKPHPLLWPWLASALACSVPPGAQGDAGQNAAGLVWRDATGATVTEGESLIYVDGQGWQWDIDPETGTPQIWSSLVYFTQAGCTGTPYIPAVRPRVPFRVVGDDRLRARGDAVQSAVVTVLSARSTLGTCADSGSYTERLLALTEDMVVTPALSEPSLSFGPPLHLEQR